MNRRTSIDLLRIISAVAVIVIHVVSASVTSAHTSVEQSLLKNTELIHVLMNWSVPVFFMITGYCLTLKQKCTYNYCLARAKNYICVLFTVGFFYALLEQLFGAQCIDATIFVTAFLNVIRGNLWDHMWFVYDIIGIYLVFPVIHKFAKDNEKEMSILTGILFVFTILKPTFDPVFPIGFTIPFGGYLFYVCFGCLIAKCSITKLHMYILELLGVVSVVWIVIGLDNWSLEYNHLLVCMMAICIFVRFSKIEMKETKIIRLLSACTWGIYLLHPFFINVILKVLKVDIVSSYPYFTMTLFVIIVFVISFVAIYTLRKIPLIKRLF